jgi:hypothetical protein
MGGHTASLTLNTSESHNDAGESGYARTVTLSQVLETGVLPQRFYLTQKACAGILRRAERKGRPVPPSLKVALMKVATSASPDLSAQTLTLDLTQDRTPTAED